MKKPKWLQRLVRKMIFKWLEKQWLAGKWSWKTSVSGILPGLAIVLMELGKIVDGDANTVPNNETLMAGIALISMGLHAKDRTNHGLPPE